MEEESTERGGKIKGESIDESVLKLQNWVLEDERINGVF